MSRFAFASSAGPDAFASAKCVRSIPSVGGLVKDALIQATLAAEVRAIDYVETTIVSDQAVALDAIVLDRADGRFHLDVVAARPLRTIEQEGLFLVGLEDLGLRSLVLTSAHIMEQPRFATARAIWRCRNHPVPFDLRCRVLGHLEDVGPTKLGRLLKTVGAEPDGGAAIFAMACADRLCIDLDERTLGPDTMVIARRR
ncbi:MAG TPA: hypothetical protein VL966_18840 [Alphaproteobacteria bacterium]|jgi:hypothetical protein|nr:hypothetical protein [Alphaproteobacteria bacterium]